MRLCLVPFILGLSLSRQPRAIAWAAALFAVAAASDWLDGLLARRLKAFSRFGAVLDPLVDKILILGPLFVFARQGLLPYWLVILNVVREAGVTAVRHGWTRRATPVAANWMGKTKFCLQVVVVELAYVYLIAESLGRTFPGGKRALFWAALGMTLVSYVFFANFVRWYVTGAIPDTLTSGQDAE